ncbi:COX15/CtaA family protein [Paenibacillus pasadenensis]|uniref:COX15/CtaA family protein n=1 Tax=Paenibacillus pasadenensis TaxID=217090 RepID=UPI00203C62C3|nr:COX15/CtaA family protein [Paenibacillus pasadenensis]MCM3748219.1 COX15/CtaA family protein [Paenibacillus pasadenensis]
MISRAYRLLAWMSCIGMFAVLMAGALVTNTGSGRGCGDDWPLCNGEFIPAFTLETAIEYSHRAVTGVVGIIVVATFVLTLQLYRRYAYREPLWYAGATLAFTIIQALMGAAAVMWPQSPPIMALHFGISLLAVASTVLLVLWISRISKGKLAGEDRSMPRSIYSLVLGACIYCYVVVYLGAYVRHTDSGGGCLGWPTCNGEVIPSDLSGATGAVFTHRVAAMLLFFVFVWLFVHIRKHAGAADRMTKSAMWILILVICQIFSGAWLTATIGDENWFIFTNMIHNFIITILFSILVDLGFQAWKRQEGRTS